VILDRGVPFLKGLQHDEGSRRNAGWIGIPADIESFCSAILRIRMLEEPEPRSGNGCPPLTEKGLIHSRDMGASRIGVGPGGRGGQRRENMEEKT